MSKYGPIAPREELRHLRETHRKLAPAIYMMALEAGGYQAAQDKVQQEIDRLMDHPSLRKAV